MDYGSAGPQLHVHVLCNEWSHHISNSWHRPECLIVFAAGDCFWLFYSAVSKAFADYLSSRQELFCSCVHESCV